MSSVFEILTEAGHYEVLPLDDRNIELFGSSRLQPGSVHAKRHYVYYPPISHIPSDASPDFGRRTWIIDVNIQRTNDTDDGVLLALGTMNGGLSFYIKNSHLVFDFNMFMDHQVVRSDITVPTGESTVRAHFIRQGKKGTLTLSINGKECGSIPIPYLLSILSSTGMDIGKDRLSPVTDDYEGPFEFSGKIHRVVVDLPTYTGPSRKKRRAEKRVDNEIRFRAEMSKQ
ncbi:hypothetical protein LCGC14_1238260 [marine sediment metagenome]|uniref:Uncharacterized protein n=1 Tax=marine sediment metagenome TaxID=412755 RepID=A0A0F9L6R1_9ZZZZ|nr:hypothetical protein [archaeon]HEC39016.1 hypothetical protein [bacterium]